MDFIAPGLKKIRSDDTGPRMQIDAVTAHKGFPDVK